ncbi:MAG: DNA gyrase inhibitor YacG [Gammaproteobacteria bacterium]|nr:DNA gyrase inhibitor YacG [Gammaproteobacteria bacterium]MCH1550524.1 DNA gyrase inhibitor YacG [Pseudomonadales bacterium]
MSETSRIIQCPTCKTSSIWSTQNPSRPFCSERCKLIDLGAWANEEHQIVGDANYEGVNSDDLS